MWVPLRKLGCGVGGDRLRLLPCRKALPALGQALPGGPCASPGSSETMGKWGPSPVEKGQELWWLALQEPSWGPWGRQ